MKDEIIVPQVPAKHQRLFYPLGSQYLWLYAVVTSKLENGSQLPVNKYPAAYLFTGDESDIKKLQNFSNVEYVKCKTVGFFYFL